MKNELIEANAAYDRGDYRTAFQIYSSLEYCNDQEVLNFLAWMYLKGVGTDSDPHKALQLFNYIDKIGCVSSEIKFGIAKCYLYIGDYVRALKIFEELCDAHQGAACYNIGRLYEYGLLGEKNIENALYFYELSEKHGNIYGRRALGLLLLKGSKGNLSRIIGIIKLSLNFVSAIDIFIRGKGLRDIRLLT